MKKLMSMFVLLAVCGNLQAGEKTRIRTQTWIISGMFVGAMSGIMAGQVSKELDDADYADRALRDSYGEMGEYYHDMEGHQLHYLAESTKHHERAGIFQGTAYTLGAVSLGLVIRGVYEYFYQKKMRVQLGEMKNADGITLVYQF